MIQPLADRVLVRLLPREDLTTEAGILLPAAVVPVEHGAIQPGSSRRARVVAVGPGRKTKRGGRVVCACRVGDTVLVQREAGAAVEVEGVEHRLLKDDGILAVLEEAP